MARRRKKDPFKEPQFPLSDRQIKIRELEGEIAHMESQIEQIRYEFLQEVADRFDLEVEDLTQGSWTCPHEQNSEHRCVYDSGEDPCHDECVFCGQPEERK